LPPSLRLVFLRLSFTPRLLAMAAERVRALVDDDFAFLLKDNPEYASQAGRHEYDAALQDLSPAAFDARIVHNEAVLRQVATLAAELAADEGSQARKARLHLELFRKSVADELTALSLKCHTYPVNSIGMSRV